jgi:hypothetical protein
METEVLIWTLKNSLLKDTVKAKNVRLREVFKAVADGAVLPTGGRDKMELYEWDVLKVFPVVTESFGRSLHSMGSKSYLPLRGVLLAKAKHQVIDEILATYRFTEFKDIVMFILATAQRIVANLVALNAMEDETDISREDVKALDQILARDQMLKASFLEELPQFLEFMSEYDRIMCERAQVLESKSERTEYLEITIVQRTDRYLKMEDLKKDRRKSKIKQKQGENDENKLHVLRGPKRYLKFSNPKLVSILINKLADQIYDWEQRMIRASLEATNMHNFLADAEYFMAVFLYEFAIKLRSLSSDHRGRAKWWKFLAELMAVAEIPVLGLDDPERQLVRTTVLQTLKKYGFKDEHFSSK